MVSYQSYNNALTPLTLRISVTDRCDLRCQYCRPERASAGVSYHFLASVSRGIFLEIFLSAHPITCVFQAIYPKGTISIPTNPLMKLENAITKLTYLG